LLLVFGAGVRAENSEWLTNYSAAKKKAKQENKPILMLFTGSDWCPNCIQWEKEAFSKPEFLEYAKTNLVLLLVDFPDKKPLPKAQERANNVLKEKYDSADEFPTVVMLDSNARQLGSFHYTEGGPKALLGKIEATREGKLSR
jgi:protein disulfide-isomerase